MTEGAPRNQEAELHVSIPAAEQEPGGPMATRKPSRSRSGRPSDGVQLIVRDAAQAGKAPVILSKKVG